jgi:hypothetical protein
MFKEFEKGWNDLTFNTLVSTSAMFLTRVFSLGISLLLASQTFSNPIHLETRNEHEDEVLVARTAPSAPYFFVHSDLSTGSSPPNPSLLAVRLYT